MAPLGSENVSLQETQAIVLGRGVPSWSQRGELLLPVPSITMKLLQTGPGPDNHSTEPVAAGLAVQAPGEPVLSSEFSSDLSPSDAS